MEWIWASSENRSTSWSLIICGWISIHSNRFNWKRLSWSTPESASTIFRFLFLCPFQNKLAWSCYIRG
jgi:hypothetical protein